MKPTFFLAIAALGGCLSVAMGAFGAHLLKSKLTLEKLSAWETAVQYQSYHVLALLAVALWLANQSVSLLQGAAICFIVGTVLFSGSLYLLALGAPRFLGMVTPLGGVLLIVGWLLLFAAAVFQLKNQA